MSENLILTWIHAMHVCAQFNIAMTELIKNYHKTSNPYVETSSRIKSGNNDLKK